MFLSQPHTTRRSWASFLNNVSNADATNLKETVLDPVDWRRGCTMINSRAEARSLTV
jgi:N12 class adenine-specific DNA methylase